MPALVLAILASLAAPTAARAQDDAKVELVSVTFVSKGQCPSDERFLANVRQHTENWQLVDASASKRRFRVVLEPQATAYRGELIIETPGGKKTRREIVAPDCDRVARGLAIAMALAIDPRASLDANRETATVPAVPNATSESGEGAASTTPNAPSSEPRADELLPKPIPNAEAPSPPPRERARTGLAFAVDARAELTSAFAETVAPVFGASLEARLHLATLPEAFAPSLAIGLRQSLPVVVESPSANVELLWSTAAVRLCPVRLTFDRVEIVPCAEANVGVLRAAAPNAEGARRTTNPWFDPGGSLRVVVRLGSSWGLGATALVSAPIFRQRFGLFGAAPISQAPPVGFTGGLLVEHRF